MKKFTKEIKELNLRLEEKVKERTSEIEAANEKLKRLNKVFIGREIRMAELKKEIEDLKNEKK